MAARENQGLQIALIIFVILTIILIVTTYFFFSSAQKEKEANKALASDNSNKDNQAREAARESEALKSTLGAAMTEKSADVDARTKKDAEVYGKGIPDANRNYRFLVEQLGTELKTANTRIAELTAQNKDLTDKIKTDETARNAEIAKYKKTMDDMAADLKGEREKFGTERQAITSDKVDLAKKFDAKRKEHEEFTKQSTSQIAELTTDKTKLRGTLERINEEKERKTKANEVPDGKVSRVNQVTRLVWINLGSEDGLRRQISFSVFDKEDTNPVESARKGMIEVVRLMGPHMAEARIVEDDLSKPIMIGDQLFSPTWEPGRPEHFALAGFMDIDGDGESDRQRIRDLIALNGGIIDAEASDEGVKSGQVSIETKYLILGTEPKGEGKINAYSEVFDEARNYGVKSMPVKEFMNYMGYRPEERTVGLGKSARPTDFKPRLPEGVQRVMPGARRKEGPRRTKGSDTTDS
jgi:uncharacterized protein (UPF0333 family)